MIEKEFSVTAQPEVEVRVQAGRVELRQGEPGRVRVSVDTGDPNFVVEQRGDLVVAYGNRNTSWLAQDSAFVIVDLPVGSDASITTASADVDCQPALGRVEVKTASGDIEIHRAATASVKTASGDARIGAITTSVSFASASGALRLTDTEGPANISTASGDVAIAEATATLEVNTASGDVRVDRFTGRQARFRSMSGHVDIGIPSGTQVDLDVTTLSGRLNLPEKTEPAGKTKRRMSINAKLVSGDMTVNRL